eukprot:scaffold96962_cov20-Tisochrysis_lutea.AAC.1
MQECTWNNLCRKMDLEWGITAELVEAREAFMEKHVSAAGSCLGSMRWSLLVEHHSKACGGTGNTPKNMQGCTLSTARFHTEQLFVSKLVPATEVAEGKLGALQHRSPCA